MRRRLHPIRRLGEFATTLPVQYANFVESRSNGVSAGSMRMGFSGVLQPEEEYSRLDESSAFPLRWWRAVPGTKPLLDGDPGARAKRSIPTNSRYRPPNVGAIDLDRRTRSVSSSQAKVLTRQTNSRRSTIHFECRRMRRSICSRRTSGGPVRLNSLSSSRAPSANSTF